MRRQNASASCADWLTVFPELNDIRDDAWLDALQSAAALILPAKTAIVRPNDPCREFLLVTQGTIRTYRRSENGRELVFYRTAAGEVCVCTLHTLLAGMPHSADVVTEDEVRAVTIPLEKFQRALAHSTAFRNFLFNALLRRLSQMMGLVEQFAFQNLESRLAFLLGQYSRQRNSTCLELTHQDIAADLGTSRETVSRLLKEFERQDCIRLRRGKIELRSPEVLARLAGLHSDIALDRRRR